MTKHLSAARRYGAEAARNDHIYATSPEVREATDRRHARMARQGKRVPSPFSW